MIQVETYDKMVDYDTLVNDIAARVAKLVAGDKLDPEMVSQRKAFALFGRANVERWRRNGRVSPCFRPGKVEYRVSDLRLLQRTEQDYFDR